MTHPSPPGDIDHLIWRLRHNETAKHLCGLAADEIEHLRAQPASAGTEREVAELAERLWNELGSNVTWGAIEDQGWWRAVAAVALSSLPSRTEGRDPATVEAAASAIIAESKQVGADRAIHYEEAAEIVRALASPAKPGGER